MVTFTQDNSDASDMINVVTGSSYNNITMSEGASLLLGGLNNLVNTTLKIGRAVKVSTNTGSTANSITVAHKGSTGAKILAFLPFVHTGASGSTCAILNTLDRISGTGSTAANIGAENATCKVKGTNFVFNRLVGNGDTLLAAKFSVLYLYH